MIVCKLGGSLLDAGRAPPLLRVLRRVAPALGVLVVSGGGRAADRVRARHRRGELGTTQAHWAAIRALDVTALRLAGGCGARLPVVTAPPLRGGRRPGRSAGGLAVLAPSPLLRAEDPLPHGWHVTSDSIAAWVARRFGAEQLVLLKARGGSGGSGARGGAGTPSGRERSGGSASALAADRAAGEGLVDRHLPALLAGAGYTSWIVNGRHPDRLLALLTGDAVAATRLVG